MKEAEDHLTICNVEGGREEGEAVSKSFVLCGVVSDCVVAMVSGNVFVRIRRGIRARVRSGGVEEEGGGESTG